MAAVLGGAPVLILKEGTQRTTGRDARRMNILAARVIAEAVRTTLGPKGMDKMLVDTLGDVTITNDGVTILKEIDVEHPAAKMMVEVAKAQDSEVGDGTTTVVVLAGELLRLAEDLLNKNIHPTIVINGFRLAEKKAMEILEEIARPVSIDDEETLKKIAMTAMSSKLVAADREYLAELAVKACKRVAERIGDRWEIDPDNIKIEKKAGGGIKDTELIDGIVLDKERVHPKMPKRVEKAKIALISEALEVKETETDAKIRITDPSQLKAFLEEEERMLREMVEKIKSVGANVVFCQKGIDDVAQHFLARAGIFAVRRVKKSDMEKLARATGGTIVSDIDDLSSEDLGEAELVEEVKIGDENMVFVRGCKNPKAVTILIRGGSEHIVDEMERSVTDAIRVVEAAIEDGKIVAGGGAPEIELARRLRTYADQVGGKEQLAIRAFADALEVIPRTLAENAGMDPVDVIVDLRAQHEQGKLWAGVDVISGKIEDMWELGVLEPLRVKKQAIKSATEAAVMILRIDDVIAASREEKKEGKEEGKKEEEEEEESNSSDLD